MSHKRVLEQLMPLPLGGDHNGDTTVEGAALDAAEASAQALLGQLRPSQGQEDLIAGWEAFLDLRPAAAATLPERRAAVTAKLLERGGLSAAYFVALAAANGFAITIEPVRPFEAGVGTVGYPIWAAEAKWCWRVNVLNHGLPPSFFFGQVPIVEGDYLWRSSVVNGPLERLFERLKPAGTSIVWYYPPTGQEVEVAWHFFTSLPPDTGVGANGDAGMAVLEGAANGNVYSKIAGAWVLQGNIRGTQWHHGEGSPASGLGVNGDLYMDSTNGDVWKKQDGQWV